MNRNLFLLTVLLCVISHSCLFAQKENHTWAFGWGSGLDFTNGTPVAIHTNMYGVDCNAVLCDANGDLLFYTNGDSVWNKNGDVMPEGNDLIAPYNTQFTSQGALIAPVLNNPDQYYVFSLQGATLAAVANEDFEAGRLFYSIVDLSLAGGSGDMVSGKKGIQLDSLLGNKMIAIPGTDCNIWLLVHERDTNRFRAYEITATGISTTPVISETGLFLTDPIDLSMHPTLNFTHVNGVMKISPDYRKLAFLSYNLFMPFEKMTGVQLFDFDPATGLVSNPVLLDSLNMCQGAAFSPDNSKLYVTCVDDAGEKSLVQFDLGNNMARTVLFTGDYTTPFYEYVDMKLAPDGKIYMGAHNVDSMHRIEEPNQAGAAAGFTMNVIEVFNKGDIHPEIGYYFASGLPNDYVKPFQDTFYARMDTASADTVMTLYIPDAQDYFTPLWSDGSTGDSLVVHTSGTYWVTYGNYCSMHTDTFVVDVAEPETIVPKISGQSKVVMEAWPNPAQDVVSVKLKGLSVVKGKLRITDALGRTMWERVCADNMQMIPVGNLSNGMYSLIYTDDHNPAVGQRTRLLIAK